MRFTASSYRYRRGYSAKNDGGLSYSGSKAQNGYKTTRMLLCLDFVTNKTESPLDGISKNVTYKLVPIDLPASPTGDMLTADLEIVTPLSRLVPLATRETRISFSEIQKTRKSTQMHFVIWDW